MTHRITYSSTHGTKLCDFKVVADTLRPNYFQSRNQNRSASGKTETINVYGIQEVSIDIFMTEVQYRKMIGWWSHARQGQAFTLTLSTADLTNTKVRSQSTDDAKVIYVTSSGNITANNKYLIRAIDNDDEYENVQVSAIASSSSYWKLTMSTDISHWYNSSDIFRGWQYWPTLISLDDGFNPMKTPGADLYSATLNLAEDL
jgi:hypothetical protein